MQVDTNISGNTHDARKHSSSPWILIHPSCSDWCPLHLVSPADTPGYGSGGRFAAQMARAFSTTCPAFSNRDDAKTRPRPTWHNTSNGKSVFPLHTIRWANGWAFWESEIPPSRPWRGPTGLNRNKRPAVVLSFSAFHNPAPTGSYGTLSRMDWLWNIVLEKQFNRNEIKQNKTNKKGISGQSHLFHLSPAIHKHSSVYIPWYCMCGSVPLIETVITGANFNQCYSGLPTAQRVPVTSWNQCCLAHELCCYCQVSVSGRTNRTIGFVDEGPLWWIRHTSPHCDRFGIARVHGSHVLIVAPVPKQEQMMSRRKTKQVVYVYECRIK